MSSYSISENSFTLSIPIKYYVDCDGNSINITFTGLYTSMEYYYGCGLVNIFDVVYDYETEFVSYKDSSIVIRSLKVENQGTYKTISGNVYYNNFPLCSSDSMKLVCLLTEYNPSDYDFLYYDNKQYNVRCTGTNVNLRIDNINANILSCAVIDESRTTVYIKDSINTEFKPVIDISDLERESHRNKSISRIKGTVYYNNWEKCSSDSYSYHLRCYGSYDPITIYDITSSDRITINCEGNEIDTVVTGKGKYVYFGCAVYSNSVGAITYDIKKMEVKLYIAFLYIMFAYSLLVHFIALFIAFCVMAIMKA